MAHAEAEEDAFFYPGFGAPAARGAGVGSGGADFSAIQRLFELRKEHEVLFAISRRRMIEEIFNLRMQLFFSR